MKATWKRPGQSDREVEVIAMEPHEGVRRNGLARALVEVVGVEGRMFVPEAQLSMETKPALPVVAPPPAPASPPAADPVKDKDADAKPARKWSRRP